LGTWISPARWGRELPVPALLLTTFASLPWLKAEVPNNARASSSATFRMHFLDIFSLLCKQSETQRSAHARTCFVTQVMDGFLRKEIKHDLNIRICPFARFASLERKLREV
jgi:hypothetical protein